MKLKPRLRRFWRNNKRIPFMWGTLWFMILSVVPPYHFGITVIDIVFVFTNAALWRMEYHRTIEHRFNNILYYKYRQLGKRFANKNWDSVEWLIKEITFVQSRSYHSTDEFITAFTEQLDSQLVKYIDRIREYVNFSEQTDNPEQ